jgi:hypothetical protein
LRERHLGALSRGDAYMDNRLWRPQWLKSLHFIPCSDPAVRPGRSPAATWAGSRGSRRSICQTRLRGLRRSWYHVDEVGASGPTPIFPPVIDQSTRPSGCAARLGHGLGQKMTKSVPKPGTEPDVSRIGPPLQAPYPSARSGRAGRTGSEASSSELRH